MNKTIPVLIFLTFFLGVLFVAKSSSASCTGSSPTWSSTPDLASVSSCVSQATPGDTINVSAGSATWSSTLTITKGVKLVGAGKDSVTISGDNLGTLYWGGGVPMIKYKPSSDNQILRVSGFTFNITNQGCIMISTNSEPTTQTNIRIHENRFTNCTIPGCVLYNLGCFGLFDNNTVDTVLYPFRIGNSGTSSGYDAWNSYSDDFHGTVSNIYVEDNTVSFKPSESILTDCDASGRYAFRYNTITLNAVTWNLWDQHEWGGGSAGYGCMGAELYGNYVTDTGLGFHFNANQGAGRVIAHHNRGDSGGFKFYSDGDGGCPPSHPVNFTDRQPLNNTYIFLNRVSATGSLITTFVINNKNVCGTVVENTSHWDDNPNGVYPNTLGNITSGIGCGPLANRPTSCTTGTGYWATNQSCTDLSNLVGDINTYPNRETISGTLYKCTDTDTWTEWYTPYTYPHPLRAESTDTTPPAPPTSVTVQ